MLIIHNDILHITFNLFPLVNTNSNSRGKQHLCMCWKTLDFTWNKKNR